jgi:hypothetical protein
MALDPSRELVKAWQEMADHTLKKCGPPHCKCLIELKPNRCCEPMYCDIAEEYAKEEYGVELKSTGHTTLKFMGPTGCTVPPHLRPMCTLHQCRICSLGCLHDDPEWTRRYFELRERLNELEANRPS